MRELAALRADAVEELVERVAELLDALLLEHAHDVVVVDAGAAQIVEELACRVDVLRQRLGDDAVILEGPDRLLGHRVHRLPANQLLDVHHVAVLGILRRRGGP